MVSHQAAGIYDDFQFLKILKIPHAILILSEYRLTPVTALDNMTRVPGNTTRPTLGINHPA